jgi:hypothetical protein
MDKPTPPEGLPEGHFYATLYTRVITEPTIFKAGCDEPLFTASNMAEARLIANNANKSREDYHCGAHNRI